MSETSFLRRFFTELKWKLVGILGKRLIDLLFSTIRIEISGFEQVSEIIHSKRAIGAVWHSRILLFSYLFKGWNLAVLVSQSDDGEITARILQAQGQETVRGSTTRGGLQALASLIRKLKEKYRYAVIIPDGPQGPRYKIQPGIIALAKKTGYPIVPLTYSARKAKIFASWDRFILPFPFTKCRVIYGKPIYVPENADKNVEEVCRIRLETELCRITEEADRFFDRKFAIG
ncbi:MAG: hypothetical protein BWK80_43900 [Desulfobacteraceae bacterium IS3]|jgi:hypothetical protein|nr:MAG: hypothetical protein BWK80_43900 [Desulfobacteraceae bacterium IS3]HAO19736.1 hypothetical protein [Desulfobacteraceae bacterium]